MSCILTGIHTDYNSSTNSCYTLRRLPLNPCVATGYANRLDQRLRGSLFSTGYSGGPRVVLRRLILF